MADNKYWTLARRLNAGTVKGKIVWEQTVERDTFQASFPGYSVVISEATDKGRIMQVMRIHNVDGEVIEVITDEDLDGEFGRTSYQVMEETYKLARRQAMGVDKAIDTILSKLDPADDEIPF